MIFTKDQVVRCVRVDENDILTRGELYLVIDYIDTYSGCDGWIHVKSLMSETSSDNRFGAKPPYWCGDKFAPL